ncbi:MAG TPA: hypothetical protein VFI39_03175 [Gemmatimonadales bacterium]|nr:hypothetical protein [Gemmatimonadales bacterium]
MTNGADFPPTDAARRLSGAIASLLLMLQVALGPGSVASRTGFGTRHRLRRALAAEGFESPSHLMGSLRIARWLWTAEAMGEALSAQALRVGRDSAVAYRLIKTRTGLPWTECRRRGTAWFIETYLGDPAAAVRETNGQHTVVTNSTREGDALRARGSPGAA